MACVHYLDWAEAHPPKRVGQSGTTRIFTSGFAPLSGTEKLKVITHRLLKRQIIIMKMGFIFFLIVES